MSEKIKPEVYDSYLRDQGLQYQIDQHYCPLQVSRKRRFERVLKALDPQPNENILDVGCGAGGFAYRAAERGAYSVGIDYSRESVKMSTVLSKKFGTSKNSIFLAANACKMPFKDASFDKAVAADFVEHIDIEDKKIFLQEIHRIIRPGGTVVIYTPNAIRETISDVYWRSRHVILGNKIPLDRTHIGLISRYRFESLVKKSDFNIKFYYNDETRPYLADIPGVKHFFALNLLWILTKR